MTNDGTKPLLQKLIEDDKLETRDMNTMVVDLIAAGISTVS